MLTTSDFVLDYVRQRPFLEYVLEEGLVNLSALARKLRPDIEKATMKKVELGAIIVALRRLSLTIKKNEKEQEVKMKILQDLTVKSNLIEYSYENSVNLSMKLTELFNEIKSNNELFFTFTHGVNETTILISSYYSEILEKTLSDEKMISKITNLSSITIRHSKDVVYTPGVHYRILKALAWENINIIESISAYCEFTIIVDNSNINEAFSVLNKLLTT